MNAKFIKVSFVIFFTIIVLIAIIVISNKSYNTTEYIYGLAEKQALSEYPTGDFQFSGITKYPDNRYLVYITTADQNVKIVIAYEVNVYSCERNEYTISKVGSINENYLKKVK